MSFLICRPPCLASHRRSGRGVLRGAFSSSFSSLSRHGAPLPPKTTQARPPSLTSSLKEVAPQMYSSIPFLADLQYKPTREHYALVAAHDAGKSLGPTRPPPLDLPARIPNATWSEWARGLPKIGKAYFGFYKTGLQQLWANYKEARQVKARLGRFSVFDAAKYGGGQKFLNNPELVPAVTRREFQLVVRSDRDMRKLPLFIPIIAICGEFTPLLVAAFPGLAPSTCQLPAQQTKTLRRWLDRHDKAALRFKQLQADFEASDGSKRDYAHMSCLWAYRNMLTPFLPRLKSPKLMLKAMRWNNPRHYDEILCDTVLILREGGFDKLSAQDLWEYAFRCGSTTATARLLQRADKDFTTFPIVAHSESMRKELARVFNDHAKVIMDNDWQSMHPQCQHVQVERTWLTSAPDSWIRSRVVKSSP